MGFDELRPGQRDLREKNTKDRYTSYHTTFIVIAGLLTTSTYAGIYATFEVKDQGGRVAKPEELAVVIEWFRIFNALSFVLSLATVASSLAAIVLAAFVPTYDSAAERQRVTYGHGGWTVSGQKRADSLFTASYLCLIACLLCALTAGALGASCFINLPVKGSSLGWLAVGFCISAFVIIAAIVLGVMPTKTHALDSTGKVWVAAACDELKEAVARAVPVLIVSACYVSSGRSAGQMRAMGTEVYPPTHFVADEPPSSAADIEQSGQATAGWQFELSPGAAAAVAVTAEAAAAAADTADTARTLRSARSDLRQAICEAGPRDQVAAVEKFVLEVASLLTVRIVRLEVQELYATAVYTLRAVEFWEASHCSSSLEAHTRDMYVALEVQRLASALDKAAAELPALAAEGGSSRFSSSGSRRRSSS